MKLSLVGAFSLDHSTDANGRRRTNGLHWTWLERAPSLAPRIPRINACVFKLNIMRIFERRLEVFIGASVGSTSSRSWISGTDPAIATSKSEDMIVACISSSSTKSATNGS